MLDLLSSLLGFPRDDEKSVSDSIQMLLLGVEVAVRWADKLVEMVVAKEKAAQWASDLEAALETRTMEDWLAEQMAGRLSFAVTASGLRVGRACVKPYYAQANAHTRHYRCSTDLVRAIGWWLAYLRHRPPARHSCALTRRSFIAWTDASGADRWLAAVLLDAAGS